MNENEVVMSFILPLFAFRVIGTMKFLFRVFILRFLILSFSLLVVTQQVCIQCYFLSTKNIPLVNRSTTNYY